MKKTALSFFCCILCFASVFAKPKRVLLWFDATANFKRFAQQDSLIYYIQKAKDCGVTDIVIDVKPISGEVLYTSAIAPELKEWNGFTKTEKFDLLTVAIAQAHALGLKVHSSINIFVGGHTMYKRGIVFTNHSNWQSINYTETGFAPITQIIKKLSAMLNPADKEVIKYQLSIIKELVEKYPQMDGIILDRVRYDGIEADFSPLSQQLFSTYINTYNIKFPEDIFLYSNDKKRVEGKYYKQWLEWRAKIIYDFFVEAKKVVKKVNPKLSFGDYTGAWYPTYFEVGVNWAANTYNTYKDYSWATEKYKNFGYAQLLDLYTTGSYFYEVSKEEVKQLNEKKAATSEAGLHVAKEDWFSVEGATELAKKVTQNKVPLYAGIYVDQYGKNKEQLQKAMVMCLQKSDGLMVFDIVHLINNNWFDILKNAIAEGSNKK